jgi:hypothetical protein
VFNAFGVIPQFPAIADIQTNCWQRPRLAANLHEAYNSLRGFAADCKVPSDLTLTPRILLESPFGSPQEVSEKR